MIVCSYIGVGAKSLSQKVRGVVNIETDAFWDYGKRPTNWQVYYCNIAKQLSSDGNIVFVSAHHEVLKRLEETAFDVSIVMYPSLRLERRWVEKMERQYKTTGSNRDFGDYSRVKEHYIRDISKISKSMLPKIEIDTMDYDLSEVLCNFIKKNPELRGSKRVLKNRGVIEDYILEKGA